MKRAALAIAAHPDDIEFMMAGTLVLLAQAGCETHYLTIASGSCGSKTRNAAATKRVRRGEARSAAKILGAAFHSSLCDDLEVLYEIGLLRRLAAIVREVRPCIVLTHSPQDYLEDHMNASRLAVSAAFAHGMQNFRTIPARRATEEQVTIYHAMPHGLCDQLRRRIVPGAFVDTSAVQAVKRAALGAHVSQQEWLDATQGMSPQGRRPAHGMPAFVQFMDTMSRAVGKMSRKFVHAEGWRRHLHLGLSNPEQDPLRDLLGKRYRVNRRYEQSLRDG